MVCHRVPLVHVNVVDPVHHAVIRKRTSKRVHRRIPRRNRRIQQRHHRILKRPARHRLRPLRRIMHRAAHRLW